MIFDVNYSEFVSDVKEIAEEYELKTGLAVQQYYLYDTDEHSLTVRERFLMILAVIKYEVENNLLTDELEDELWFYYKDYNEGRLDGILGDDEEEEVIKDLLECYHKVFG